MHKFAVIGDVHGRWTDADNAWFSQSPYDAAIFVGDLAGLRWSGTLDIARRIGDLELRRIVVPGNHDATHVLGLAAEALRMPAVGGPFTRWTSGRLGLLEEALNGAEIGAYSLHQVGSVSVIAGRPHSMGGPGLAFVDALKVHWEVDSLDASAARLCALVDEAGPLLIFVAHNGPTGLGTDRAAIWGNDFRRGAGDWGDPDLRIAIDYARTQGKKVLAVVAGHMHRRLKGGGTRVWKVQEHGTVYVNAAEVPRIRAGEHHHVAITIEGEHVSVEDRWVVP